MSTITEDLKNIIIDVKKDKLKFILSMFLLANFIFLVAWRVIDTRPPTWDPALHLTSTIMYYYLLSNGNFNPFIWLKVDQYYPPFYTISAVPFYAIFHNADGTVLINFIYYFILVISTYLLTLEITNNKKYAILAGILVGLTPSILNLELSFMLDLPLASLVALSIYFLIKSEGFTNKKYSILFGLAFGCAMLTKWSAFVFVVPPALYLLVVRIKENYKNREFMISLGKNLGYCFIVFSIIALPWYLYNFNVVVSSLFYFGYNVAKVEGNPNPLSLASAVYYTHVMILQALPEYLMLIFSVVVLFFLNKKDTLNEKEISILLWIFTSLFILTFILRNKKGRYILPIYSGIVTLFFVSLERVNIKNTIKRYLPLTFIGLSLISGVYCVQKPIHQNWHADDIIKVIAKDVKKHPELIYNDGRVVIAELQPYPYINGRTLQYFALRDGYPFVVLNVAYITPIEYMNSTQLAKLFSLFDYIVCKTGEYRTPWKFIVDKAVVFFNKYERQYYTPIANFTLPDGSKVIIYRRKI